MTASRHSRSYLLVAVVALATAVLWWTFGRSSGDAAQPVIASSASPAPAIASGPAGATPAPAAAVVSAPSEEVMATARMYAAHAPLRVPEVADPDSHTNKQILATMVTKALAQSAQPASGPAPTQP